MSTIDALRVRRILGRHQWAPPRPFGPDGWLFTRHDRAASLIATAWEEDSVEWLHASFARASRMPEYDDLQLLHIAVFDQGYAYQVFTPTSDHVNIHEYALHLWGRADGKPALPEFGREGTI